MTKRNINLKKLNIELYYHPPWPKDRPTFIRLLNQSDFTNNDVITFARLYVKYSHLHCFYINELKNYFHYMLAKMQINNPEVLFKSTCDIYKKSKDTL